MDDPGEDPTSPYPDAGHSNLDPPCSHQHNIGLLPHERRRGKTRVYGRLLCRQFCSLRLYHGFGDYVSGFTVYFELFRRILLCDNCSDGTRSDLREDI